MPPDDVSSMVDALKRYPTSDDAKFARGQDWSYGQPFAPYFTTYGQGPEVLSGSPNDWPLKSIHAGKYQEAPELSYLEDLHAKAALATNRSPLAALGYEPRNTAVDIQRDPKQVNISGMYNSNKDQIYANAQDPSVIVHESMHRGLQKLHDSPYWKKELNPLWDAKTNEYLVRALMQRKMGDPESDDEPGSEGQKQQEMAKKIFDLPLYDQLLKKAEDAAAQYIAAKKPRGPR